MCVREGVIIKSKSVNVREVSQLCEEVEEILHNFKEKKVERSIVILKEELEELAIPETQLEVFRGCDGDVQVGDIPEKQAATDPIGPKARSEGRVEKHE